MGYCQKVRVFVKTRTSSQMDKIISEMYDYETKYFGVSKYSSGNKTEISCEADKVDGWEWVREISRRVLDVSKDVLILADVHGQFKNMGYTTYIYCYCSGYSFVKEDKNNLYFFQSNVDIKNPNEWLDATGCEFDSWQTDAFKSFGIYGLKKGYISLSEIYRANKTEIKRTSKLLVWEIPLIVLGLVGIFNVGTWIAMLSTCIGFVILIYSKDKIMQGKFTGKLLFVLMVILYALIFFMNFIFGGIFLLFRLLI